MNNIVLDRCPVLIIEQQPCLYVLLRSLLDQAGFGPVYHVQRYTTMIARWAMFFGAIVLLDVPLQNNAPIAFADSSLHDPQEYRSSGIISAPDPLLLLLAHANQFAALPQALRSPCHYLVRPFGPDELLRQMSALAYQHCIRVRIGEQAGSNHSTVRVRQGSVGCFTLADLGDFGRSVW